LITVYNYYSNTITTRYQHIIRFEAHFNSTEATHVVQGSTLALPKPQNTLGPENTTTTRGMITHLHEETAYDMLIEYFSKDPLGDLA
jgi:hypothetical protein